MFILVGDEQMLLKAIRCLCLLLIYNKTKPTEGDIQFFMKFVPVSRLDCYINSYFIMFCIDICTE